MDSMNEQLYKIAAALVAPKKGILAADQSARTMNKQLEGIGVAGEAENRRVYRQLLFTTEGIEQYVSGIILYDGTIRSSTDTNIPFVDLIVSKGIIPIIKVDKSTVPMTGFAGEVLTEGLDGLDARLKEYYEMGARAAKWRAVVNIGADIPTDESIKFNALLLARYVALCQENNIVPIVEPEVIFSGSHDLAKAEEVTTRVLRTVFAVLSQYRVDMKGLILKSSMVLAGSEHPEQTPPEQVAEATLRTFQNSVPEDVPGIVFLSGGQTPERATKNLNAIAKKEQEIGNLPWQLAFSFSRAIEQPVQDAWMGKADNIASAQETLREVLARNVAADQGALN
ncbi:MAG: fructose-bisphosphate aldolase class I [Pseudomonadales bacterium]|nr:fructose-bisphosphate aldolase class I [Pseudomonadales bacterium]